MTLRKKIQKTMHQSQLREEVLFRSSRAVLSISSLLFFSVFFAISAGFYAQKLTIFFIPLYVGFLVSYISFLCISTHYFGAKKNISKIFLWGVNILWIIMGCIFLYPLF